MNPQDVPSPIDLRLMEDAVEWERNIMAVVGELSKRIAPHPVKVGLLRDDADSTVRANSVAAFRRDIAQMASAARDSVLVLPVLISTGSINRTKLPADIAGLPVRYTAVGLTPSASLAAWIGRIASEALVDVVVEFTGDATTFRLLRLDQSARQFLDLGV